MNLKIVLIILIVDCSPLPVTNYNHKTNHNDYENPYMYEEEYETDEMNGKYLHKNKISGYIQDRYALSDRMLHEMHLNNHPEEFYDTNELYNKRSFGGNRRNFVENENIPEESDKRSESNYQNNHWEYVQNPIYFQENNLFKKKINPKFIDQNDDTYTPQDDMFDLYETDKLSQEPNELRNSPIFLQNKPICEAILTPNFVENMAGKRPTKHDEDDIIYNDKEAIDKSSLSRTYQSKRFRNKPINLKNRVIFEMNLRPNLEGAKEKRYYDRYFNGQKKFERKHSSSYFNGFNDLINNPIYLRDKNIFRKNIDPNYSPNYENEYPDDYGVFIEERLNLKSLGTDKLNHIIFDQKNKKDYPEKPFNTFISVKPNFRPKNYPSFKNQILIRNYRRKLAYRRGSNSNNLFERSGYRQNNYLEGLNDNELLEQLLNLKIIVEKDVETPNSEDESELVVIYENEYNKRNFPSTQDINKKVIIYPKNLLNNKLINNKYITNYIPRNKTKTQINYFSKRNYQQNPARKSNIFQHTNIIERPTRTYYRNLNLSKQHYKKSHLSYKKLYKNKYLKEYSTKHKMIKNIKNTMKNLEKAMAIKNGNINIENNEIEENIFGYKERERSSERKYADANNLHELNRRSNSLNHANIRNIFKKNKINSDVPGNRETEGDFYKIIENLKQQDSIKSKKTTNTQHLKESVPSENITPIDVDFQLRFNDQKTNNDDEEVKIKSKLNRGFNSDNVKLWSYKVSLNKNDIQLNGRFGYNSDKLQY